MVTMPVNQGFVVTSGFGPRAGGYHWGVDLGLAGGSGGKPVYAVKDGTVTRAGVASGFGQWVTVDHPASNGGGETVYGHIIPEVRAGQAVKEGQRIARINPDSRTNGGVAPHLHMEWHRYSWAPPGPDRLDPWQQLSGARWPGTTPAAAPVPAAALTTGSVNLRAKQYEATVTQLTDCDSGPRDPSQCQLAVVHTYECPRGDDLEGRAGWQRDSKTGSYNILVGTKRTLRANDDNYIPWAAMPTGNRRGLHASVLAYAASSREEWLRYDVQLGLLADVIADWCKRYNIPVVKLTANQVRAGQRGICGHGEISGAWHESDHTDPGANFPWDAFIPMVRQRVDGSPSSAERLGMETAKYIITYITDFIKGFVGPIGSDVKDVREELTGSRDKGQWAGLHHLGGRTQADALGAIGEKLGIPGMYDKKGRK